MSRPVPEHGTLARYQREKFAIGPICHVCLLAKRAYDTERRTRPPAPPREIPAHGTTARQFREARGIGPVCEPCTLARAAHEAARRRARNTTGRTLYPFDLLLTELEALAGQEPGVVAARLGVTPGGIARQLQRHDLHHLARPFERAQWAARTGAAA